MRLPRLWNGSGLPGFKCGGWVMGQLDFYEETTMKKLKPSVVAVLVFGAASGAGAQQPSPPQPPQSPNMTFFVTSTGPGKGADLGGIESADRYCQQLASAALDAAKVGALTGPG